MKTDLVAKRVVVEVVFDVVTIQLHTGDEYAARVLHDDICDRLRSGATIGLSMAVSPQQSQQEV